MCAAEFVPAKTPCQVAVYGTLLSGCRNHHLMENCELVGAGEASGVAIFAHLGVRCPAASLMDGATARVEVYRVPDDEAMAGLDKLECYPEWYNRDLLPITLSDSGAKTKAWLYYMAENEASRGGEAERIESGSWKAYLDSQNWPYDKHTDIQRPPKQSA
eukprot:PRCOL_00003970-RA